MMPAFIKNFAMRGIILKSFFKKPPKLYTLSTLNTTVAHTVEYVCSKILYHGLNHVLLFSIFNFLSAQMALVSTFFQMFIALGMYM